MKKSRGIYAPRSFGSLESKLEANSMPEPNSGCQLWLGRVDQDGYGRVSVPTGRQMATHRASYLLAHGPIPAALNVCHKCDVPACINPAHLFLGTARDNVDDMVRKGRARAKAHIGSLNGSAILDEARAVAIREARGTQRAIAERFGISPTTVFMIKNGRSWTHARAAA